MQDTDLTFHLQLTEDEAWQLAQACKRIYWDVARTLSEGERETYLLLHATSRVRHQLAQQGFNPR